MVKGYQSRSPCCTIFMKEDETSFNELLSTLKEWKVISFASCGHETCPETGRKHLQCYFEFTYPVLDTTFYNKIGRHCYYKSRTRSAVAAKEYTEKGDQSHEEWDDHKTQGPNYGVNADVVQWGTMSEQGKPSVITAFCDKLAGGLTMRQCAQDDPDTYVRFYKGIERWHNMCNVTPRDGSDMPETYVLYGSSGSGKSKAVHQHVDADDTYFWNPGMGNWFDGYYGQKTVVLEEFRGQIPFAQLLAMLDRYRCKVPVKGAIQEFVATKIFICSPTDPRNWYKNMLDAEEEGGETNLRSQMFRRFKRIYNTDAPLVKAIPMTFD